MQRRLRRRQWHGRCQRLPAAQARASARTISAAAASKSSAVQLRARIVAVDIDAWSLCSLSHSARVVASARASAALPGRGRGPRRTARSSIAIAGVARLLASRRAAAADASAARAAAPARMPSSATSAASRAKTPARRVGERVAAGIVDRHIPARRAPRARGAPARGRRHQRGGLVRCVAHRLAQRDRDRERFFVGVRGFDHVMPASAPAIFAANAGRSIRCCQRSVAAAGRSASDTSVRGRAAPAAPSVATSLALRRRCARSSACMANCGWPATAACVCAAADAIPGVLVEIGIEPRQHHGAMRQRRDGREQLGGRRHRAGGAGGNHRAVGVARKPLALPHRSAGRGARPARCAAFALRIAGHASCAILQEVERRAANSWSMSSGTSVVELFPRHLPRRHVVHQAREIVGQRERGGGRLATSGAPSPRCASPAMPTISGSAAPAGRWRSSAVDGVGQLERRRPTRRGIGEDESRPRRYRRSARCAAGSRPRVPSTSRNTSCARRQARRVGR